MHSLESLLKLRPESEKKCVKDPKILRHTTRIIKKTSVEQTRRVLRGRELFPVCRVLNQTSNRGANTKGRKTGKPMATSVLLLLFIKGV